MKNHKQPKFRGVSRHAQAKSAKIFAKRTKGRQVIA